jgi:flagellar hook-basal body complex protein FliE
MVSPVNGVGQLDQMMLSMIKPAATGGDSSKSSAVDFQKMLLDVVGQTNAADGQAQQAIGDYQMDTGISKPEVFIAIRKAEMALRMTMQIRNKLLEAFDEIKQMRM